MSSQHPSRPISLSIRLAAAAVLLLGQTTRAATIHKANNTTALNLAGSWVEGSVPGTADIALWDSTVASGNTVTLGGNLTFGELQITNPGGAVSISSNTLTLNGVSGTGIDMSAATQSLTISSAVALGGSQSWNVGSSVSLTVSGVTSGAFALSKDGAGTLTLSAADTYSLGTNINAGTLALSGASATAGTGTIAIGANGTLSLAGQTLSNTITGAGVININDASSSVTFNAGSLTGFTGTVNISSSGGSSNKTVVGANTAAGATFNVASGGTLYIQSTSSSASAITVAGGGNNENLGALRVEGTVSGPVTLTGSATIGDLSPAGTISGSIGDGGNGYGIVKQGNQTLSLTGANTYGGGDRHFHRHDQPYRRRNPGKYPQRHGFDGRNSY